jgi:hypothetical protein
MKVIMKVSSGLGRRNSEIQVDEALGAQFVKTGVATEIKPNQVQKPVVETKEASDGR